MRLSTCLRPPRAARLWGVCEGVFWRAGGSCSPRTWSLPRGQQLFTLAGRLEALGPTELGDGVAVVPWAWDEVAPQQGDLRAEDGRGSLCSSPRGPTNPPGAAAALNSRRSQDVQGLSPRRRSGGASPTLQRSPQSRRTGSKAISMAICGVLTVCLVKLCLLVVGKRAPPRRARAGGAGLYPGGSHSPRRLGVLGTASGNSFLLAVL